MTKKNVDTNATPEVVVPAVEIIRGRMLLPIVFVIKFLDKGTDAEMAVRYRTTGGKISDLVNNRNFGYVNEDTRFLADDINDAVIFAEQLGEHEDTVKALLAKLVPGSAEDVEAMKAVRLGARKSKPKADAAEPVEEVTEGVEEEPLV